MPVYCTIYTLYGPTLYSGMPMEVKAKMMINVGLYACLNPLVTLGIFIALGKVSDMEMPKRSERSLPLLVISIITLIGVYIMGGALTWTPIGHMIIGESIILLFAAVVSMWWKISLHTLGVGAMLSYVVILGLMFRADFGSAAAWTLLLSGLAAWARLYEKAHTPSQLLVGYVMGMSIMTIVMYAMVSLP